MLIFVLIVAICVVGLIVYLVAAQPKTTEAGRLAYMWGLIAVLWCLCFAPGPLAKLFLRQ